MLNALKLLEWKKEYIEGLKSTMREAPIEALSQIDNIDGKERLHLSEVNWDYDDLNMKNFAVLYYLLPSIGKGMRYVYNNFPAKLLTILNTNGESLNIKAGLHEVFDSMKQMSDYGLNLFLNNGVFPISIHEQLLQTLKTDDYSTFTQLCNTNNIDINRLGELFAFQTYWNSLTAEVQEQLLDHQLHSTEDTSITIDNFIGELIRVVSSPIIDATATTHKDYEDVKQIGNAFEWLDNIATNSEEKMAVFALKNLFMSGIQLYNLYDLLSPEEIQCFNEVLDHPIFHEHICILQNFFLEGWGHLPNGVTIQIDKSDIKQFKATDSTTGETDEGVDDKSWERDRSFQLPLDFFEKPINREDCEEFFDVKNSVEEGGAERFTRFINYLTSQGYIDNNDRTKRLLVYTLTGRWRPDDYQSGETIIWKDNGNEGKELCYIIKSIIASNKKEHKYDKMHKFFTGPNWSKTVPDKDQGNNASKNFKKALHYLYPTICKL